MEKCALERLDILAENYDINEILEQGSKREKEAVVKLAEEAVAESNAIEMGDLFSDMVAVKIAAQQEEMIELISDRVLEKLAAVQEAAEEYYDEDDDEYYYDEDEYE